MKSTSKTIITFAVLLTGLVHITTAVTRLEIADRLEPQYKEINIEFDVFMEKLCKVLWTPEAKELPISYVAKERLVTDLRKTSLNFKSRCTLCCKRDDVLPALYEKAIRPTFGKFHQRLGDEAHKKLLEGIETMDPIGFIAHLAENNVDEYVGPANLDKYVEDYDKKMLNESGTSQYSKGESSGTKK